MFFWSCWVFVEWIMVKNKCCWVEVSATGVVRNSAKCFSKLVKNIEVEPIPQNSAPHSKKHWWPLNGIVDILHCGIAYEVRSKSSWKQEDQEPGTRQNYTQSSKDRVKENLKKQASKKTLFQTMKQAGGVCEAESPFSQETPPVHIKKKEERSIMQPNDPLAAVLKLQKTMFPSFLHDEILNTWTWFFQYSNLDSQKHELNSFNMQTWIILFIKLLWLGPF